MIVGFNVWMIVLYLESCMYVGSLVISQQSHLLKLQQRAYIMKEGSAFL